MLEHHTCKGSLAIAEETIEACCGNPSAGASVLLFAAMLAGVKAGRLPQEMAAELLRLERAARTLLGDDAGIAGRLS